MKTGGLADVTGSLPKYLDEGNDIVLIMPLYKAVDEKFSPSYYKDYAFNFDGVKTVVVKELRIRPKIKIYFIGEHGYFFRDEIYGSYSDNAERFAFFSAFVCFFLEKENIAPDIIHSHDWQAALVALYGRKKEYFNKTVFAFTIHNLAYQGVFPKEKLFKIGLDYSYFTPDTLEFYGNLNFMKAGIIYSDFFNTVSPTYRNETLTPEFGNGLDGLLKAREKDYYGILNGIDYSEWDPARDKALYKNYSLFNMENKLLNKINVLKDLGLSQEKNIPLFVAVTRLAEQKGMDLMAEAVKYIAENGGRFILLGSGEKRYEEMFRSLENKYKNNVRCVLKYDFNFSKKLYAAGDFFLMPSYFEPCGLSQLIALKYGNIPIVRKTGGLADTIFDYDEETNEGNGIVFSGGFEGFEKALKKAFYIFEKDSLMKKLMKNAMKCDYSWNKTSKEYLTLYKRYKNARV
jgi:starch synthase